MPSKIDEYIRNRPKQGAPKSFAEMDTRKKASMSRPPADLEGQRRDIDEANMRALTMGSMPDPLNAEADSMYVQQPMSMSQIQDYIRRKTARPEVASK